MAGFYAGTRGFGMTAAPATVPIVRTEGKVFPTSAPPSPSAVPSAPAAFAPYTIRPEVLGQPVPKGVVPGMYDRSTVTSLFPSLTAASAVPSSPLGPQPVQPLSSPSPVQQIFNTHAAVQSQQALMLDQQARVHSDVAADLQNKADVAAHAADTATAHATMNPTFDAQAASQAAAARAADAQAKANAAARQAARVNAQADAKAAQAQTAIDQAQKAEIHHAILQQQAIDTADQKAADSLAPGQQVPDSWVPQATDDTGWTLPPGLSTTTGALMSSQASVPGFSVSPVVAAGGLGIVGFLLGGVRGGALGALLGGGAAYIMAMRQSAPAQGQSVPWLPYPVPTGGPSGGGVPNPGPQFYNEFSPYQMPDGTPINSQADQDAWYNAHPHIN